MPAIGRNADSSWLQVNYNGTIGWIATYLLNVTVSPDVLPIPGANVPPPVVVEPVVPPPVSATGPAVATNARAITVRNAPNNNGTQLGELPAGTTFGLNGRWGTGNRLWVRFDFNGQRGWVAARGLTITGDVNSLLDVEAAQNTVVSLCAGGAAPEVAFYDGAPGIHPVLVLSNSGGRHTWSRQMGRLGVGNALGVTQLVACLGDEQEVVAETCPYFGPDIVRYIYQIDVRLIVAQTGQQIANTTLTGNFPRECRSSEPYNLTRLAGSRVTLNHLRDWLQPYVNP
jgi:uncharacterized protein YraI